MTKKKKKRQKGGGCRNQICDDDVGGHDKPSESILPLNSGTEREGWRDSEEAEISVWFSRDYYYWRRKRGGGSANQADDG